MDLDVGLDSHTEETLGALASLGWAVAAISWVVDADRALQAAGRKTQSSASSPKPQRGGEASEKSDDDDSDKEDQGPKSLEAQLPAPESLATATGGQLPVQDYFARKRKGNGDDASTTESEIERYTRLTVEFRGIAGLNYVLQHPVTACFDLVVLRITSVRALQVAMQIVRESSQRQIPFDAIHIPLTAEDKIPFRLGPAEMLDLRRARIFVELSYIEAMPITGARTTLRSRAISNARWLLEHTSGGSMKKAANTNIIVSSGKPRHSLLQLRAPEQVAAIATTFGLSPKQAQCAITTNGEALLERARIRRAHH